MSVIKPLIQLLSKHFSMHPSRFQTFTGLISGGNIQHHGLARHVNSSTQKAAVKRIELFFKDQALSIEMYALTVVYLLGFSGNFKLRLDRTNWKIGHKNVNYLMLSWQISEQISLPLLAVKLGKAGNSNTTERVNLIQKFVYLFWVNRIAELVADREFIGDQWIRYLQENSIPFFVRVKANMQIPFGNGTCDVKNFITGWDEGRPRKIEKEMFGTTVYFAFKIIKNGELLIVMTNQDLPVGQILTVYKLRWSIETLFKNLKTSGLNWENTHMTDPKRLIKLLIIMGLATLFIYLIGIQKKKSGETRLIALCVLALNEAYNIFNFSCRTHSQMP